MNISPLLKLFDQLPAYQQFADALHHNQLTDALRGPLGVITAARPALLAMLQADLDRPILLLTARADHARVLTEQLQIWSTSPQAVHRLPNPDALPYEKVSWGMETIQERLATLTALALYRQHRTDSDLPAPIVVASAKGLMQGMLPPTAFTLQQLRPGQRINIRQTVQQWVDWGYQAEAEVEIPGTFSRRGGILDIFPPGAPAPVRSDLFDDEIDSLRTFDPSTQRSQDRLKQVEIGPATETLPVLGPQVADQLNQLTLDDLQPSTKATFEEEIGKLVDQRYFRGIEFYLPFFYSLASPDPKGFQNSSGLFGASLFDYLPDDTLIFIEDPSDLALTIDEIDEESRKLQRTLTDVGDLPAGWPQPYRGWKALHDILTARNALNLGFAGQNGSDDLPFFQTTFKTTPVYGGQVKKVVEETQKRLTAKERVVLISRQSNRLHSLLQDEGQIIATPKEELPLGSPPPAVGSVTLLNGVLMEGMIVARPPDPEGFQNPQGLKPTNLLTLFSDSEIFGWKKPTATRRRKPRRGVSPETFFADVSAGDMVVHIEHGIGKYIGLVKMEIDGIAREYLAVEYAKNDKLYVPIHQADRLARYIGADENAPNLSRLGSPEWKRTKKRTQKAIEDLADELIEIYAQREVVKGHAFAPDSDWQREMEDSFPFVETDDQLQAIEEIKVDMEKTRPMDRLVCGDVGYGKTEVALRAAFKAVNDGQQVAVLVPTTVLAQQHFLTFQRRLENYPVQVEQLSRFRTKKQQEQTILNLATGTTDIVVGTHRLLQKDVGFQRLGLVIIDEEQRFGVKHKERLKQMRATIDVLTLTATPIPRTLHMSLSGIRDLSTINTPPEERLPIHTLVTEFDETIIRTAVQRELDRGGQVFYVFNRVQGIEQKGSLLKKLIPDVRVLIGHGQMSERQLEKVMVDFVAGEADVLVATTIIESGLDMPNVNTIIIDRADRMGLAQLYQLRGRVGRGARQAYAYMLTPKHYKLPEDSRKRLEAITEANELGAGFRIAMRDLEIRGAGDLLGSRQHGQIAAVGFDLYTRLLTQAIAKLGSQRDDLAARQMEEAADYLLPLEDGIQITLPLTAYVPDDYMPDDKVRLRLYRRLAGLTTINLLDDMAKELEDRFGDLPEPVANLLYQLRLKVLAREAKVHAIVMESGLLVIKSEALEWLDRDGLQRRISSISKLTPRQLWLYPQKDPQAWQATIEKTLRLMARMLNDVG